MKGPRQPRVTEHALFRYCERVMGADRAWIASRIKEQLPTTNRGALKSGLHPIEGGKFNALVANNCVVTILFPEEKFAAVKRAAQLKRRYRIAAS